MKRLSLVLLAIPLSGLMLYLALPPISLSPLGFCAFVPLMWTCRGRSFALAFVASLVSCFFAAWLSLTGWLLQGSPDGHAGWHYLAFGLFGITSGLVVGIWSQSKRLTASSLFLLAAWATLFEAGMQVILPANIALTQYQSMFYLTLSSFGGIWLASYVVWLANFMLASAFDARLRFKGLQTAAAAIILSLIPSTKTEEAVGRTRIALLQYNAESSEPLVALNKEAKKGGAWLTVWPELSGNTLAAAGDPSPLIDLAREPGQSAFITSYTDASKPMPYNACALFSASGESEVYHKRRPFAGEMAMHRAGDRPVAASFQGHKVGLAVCFDSCYPGIMRETARLDGVDLIAVPSMGPNTPYSYLQCLHGAFSSFRAAELGIPIICSDTTGYSRAINKEGTVLSAAMPGHQGLHFVEVNLESRNTFYKRYGDWFIWLCGAWVVYGAGKVVARRRSDRSDSSD